MRLKELIQGFAAFPSLSLGGVEDMEITGLALDSREIVDGNVFIALAGSRQHGLAHVAQTLDKGACAVVFDPAGGGMQMAEQIKNVPMIAVDDLSLKLGEIAARYYGNPSRFMAVIGITGTNGKTSCSQFLSQMLDDCGIIGTLGWGKWGKLNKTINTTPDALETQRILAELLKDKKKTVAMEVSSHGLEQGRINGVIFKGAVFTNISRDHLDYHGTMEAYLQAKLMLLNKPGLAFAVVNLDDFYSDQIIAAVPKGVVVWGVSVQGKSLASCEYVSAENILHKVDGIEFDVGWRGDIQRVKVPLYGDFNVENILTVLAVMLATGVPMSEAV
ncbi:MAG: UDP-N-acetylmuramoyl-L-alanyl-D-glutamate--2,6-diaminopimelate ligase [Methylococcales bacterium]|nr:UDP-N-acetylmuramoyl-L-alanyl-D-glutamate--2,6-diaminopimelate ligase [Methylococcales bacterium]